MLKISKSELAVKLHSVNEWIISFDIFCSQNWHLSLSSIPHLFKYILQLIMLCNTLSLKANNFGSLVQFRKRGWLL